MRKVLLLTLVVFVALWLLRRDPKLEQRMKEIEHLPADDEIDLGEAQLWMRTVGGD